MPLRRLRPTTTWILLGLTALGALAAVFPGRERLLLAQSPELPWSPEAEVAPTRPTDAATPKIRRDLPEIREAKVLTMVAPYNSTTYFLYRGEPMGYEYDLLKAFAREHGLKLRVVLARDGEQLTPMLLEGDGDIVAARLIPPSQEEAARQGVAFTHALYRTRPTLVQQKPRRPAPKLPRPVKQIVHERHAEGKPDAPGAMGTEVTQVPARLITRPVQLAGEKVTLPRASPFHRTLLELEQEISGDIYVVDVGGGVDTEALIEQVSTGQVDLTVAQENLAELKEAVYSNLSVTPTLGPLHSIAWEVRRNSPALLAELNRWIEKKQDGALFRQLYRKYFVDRRRYRERVKSRYLTSKTGRLSAYDGLLKRHAPAVDWDWRLLASQAYQESKFEPRARSWAGATGLLQLMPATARHFGVRNRLDPEQNVRGGVAFLKWLVKYWSTRIPDEEERLKFVLASYNAGPGHVGDGRRLAEKHGDNPNRWDDVAYWMLQLSQKQYYNDPVVRYGFCRGLEPVTYVGIILERYDHYRQFVQS
jgi:membrane-bound lytic murein transglycosylase F